MDIQLPEVSGLEITKRLKEDEELRGIPVVAVTAFAMKGDEEKIRQGGCEGYIAKPISIAGFMKVVEHHLPERRDAARRSHRGRDDTRDHDHRLEIRPRITHSEARPPSDACNARTRWRSVRSDSSLQARPDPRDGGGTGPDASARLGARQGSAAPIAT